MTNSEHREWVEQSLAYWNRQKTDRCISRKRIRWEIEQLTKMLDRLPPVPSTGA
jgi:hypothetical protein